MSHALAPTDSPQPRAHYGAESMAIGDAQRASDERGRWSTQGGSQCYGAASIAIGDAAGIRARAVVDAGRQPVLWPGEHGDWRRSGYQSKGGGRRRAAASAMARRAWRRSGQRGDGACREVDGACSETLVGHESRGAGRRPEGTATHRSTQARRRCGQSVDAGSTRRWTPSRAQLCPRRGDHTT